MSKAEQGPLAALKAILDADPELIGGAKLDDVVPHVMLEVAYSPVLPYRCDDHERNPPTPAKVTQLESGNYWVDGVAGYIKPDALKVMRCRYLLVRGVAFKNMRTYSYPEQRRIAHQYDIHWLPSEGSELAKEMGVR